VFVVFGDLASLQFRLQITTPTDFFAVIRHKVVNAYTPIFSPFPLENLFVVGIDHPAYVFRERVAVKVIDPGIAIGLYAIAVTGENHIRRLTSCRLCFFSS